jgi:hypothetical protein
LLYSFHPPFYNLFVYQSLAFVWPLTVHRKVNPLAQGTFSPIAHPPFRSFSPAQCTEVPKKEAMNIFQCPWLNMNKKAVGNVGAARGLSPYLGAGQGAGSSLFHHQHHQAVEETL